MPNGFLPTDLPPILPVDPIPTRRPLQSAGGGFVKPTRSKRSAQSGGTNETARAARANEPAKRPQKIKLLRIGAGIRPRMARWIDPMVNPVGAPGSALCFERRERRKKWRRNVEKAAKRLCRFRRGAKRAKGRGGGGRGESRKKGGENGKGGKKRRPDGAKKKKKTEDQVRRFAAPGDKKKRSHAASFFSAFCVGAPGRLNPAKRVNLA